jgi:uncharacterized repeat protein (TIGR03803 family)
MRLTDKWLYAYPFHARTLLFKFVLAILFMASASFVGAQTLQSIYSFTSTNGENPSALTLGNDGNFYATTPTDAGAGNPGTVFQVTTNGALTTLVPLSGAKGVEPEAALTLGPDGKFYGTAWGGGIKGVGTVFSVTTNGALTSVASFSLTNGAFPTAALTLGQDGNFYGTTFYGGITNATYLSGSGTVFRVTTNGMLRMLFAFNRTNGANPFAALTLGNDGNFYGTTREGGIVNAAYPNGMGTVFQVTTNGTLSTLAFFEGTNGAGPAAALTLGNDGNFYGTTQLGGSGRYGTLFQMASNGTLTALVLFAVTNGSYPEAAMTLGTDGNFYGTTSQGGTNGGYGTIFQATTNGALTTLVALAGTNGANPATSLTLGNDGNFYGTTSGGGSGEDGTVFRLLLRPVITIQPQSQTNYAGATVTFSVTATSFYPASYQWLSNDTMLANGGNISGATNSTLTITDISDEDAASYSVILSSIEGSESSSNATLTVNDSLLIATQPLSQAAVAGSTVTFSLTAYGDPPLVFQWQKNSANLTNGGNISGATNSTLTITDISDSDAASYSVLLSNATGTVLSSNATLTVIDPPIIAAQPPNLLVLAGSNATFGVSLTSSAPAFYQWQFNSSNLLSATNVTYTIPSAVTNEAGYYSVVVSNQAGSVTSSVAALTVVLSPASQTDPASSTATFTVIAISPESLNYQWQKNSNNLADGGNISGATNSTLIIASLSDADAAIYTAVVSDASTNVTTAEATLSVDDLLIFATQPLSQTVGTGSTVTFTATAYGASPLVFQWYFNQSPVGPPFSGSNVASYTLTDVGTNQAGNYGVQVYNGSGSLRSSNAVLTVILQPTLAVQILAGYPLLNLYGTLGNSFLVQYSPDLSDTNWINLLSLTNLSTSPYPFLDPSGAGQAARFYRAFFTQ